ncbi:toll/interleukin-1 receptor domain-containing protein [Magnetococcus sp. PR-3]|uniref:toll/interleukin-1 receptor domain-containing protein n=1 Tax=Magnetococcus sp. PR-3 TaxID=3120355 RepID=UPI002FCE5FEC
MDKTARKKIFLSGPFTNSCLFVRGMIEKVFSDRGFEVLQKHGEVLAPSSELIKQCDAMLYIYGTSRAGIRDVWNRSLVVRELEFAAMHRKPGAAVFIGLDDAVTEEEVSRLRTHLRRQLENKVLSLSGMRDDEGNGNFIALASIIYTVIDAAYNHNVLQELYQGKLSDEVIVGLSDKQTARLTIAALKANSADANLPGIDEVSHWIKQIEAFVGQWGERVGPVVNDQVFISYSSHDVEMAERLETALKRYSYAVWRDESKLEGGAALTQTLLQGVATSGVMLVLCSEAAANSDWVAREIELGLSIQKESGLQNFVVPLRLDGAVEGVVSVLRDVKHLPLETELFEEHVEHISKQIAKPRVWHREHDQ